MGSEELKSRGILFVDDSRTFLELVGCGLGQRGFLKIRTATTVGEARAVLRESAVEVVVADWRLPDEDGLEFLFEVRRSQPMIDCILLTGFGEELGPSRMAGINDAEIRIASKASLGSIEALERILLGSRSGAEEKENWSLGRPQPDDRRAREDGAEVFDGTPGLYSRVGQQLLQELGRIRVGESDEVIVGWGPRSLDELRETVAGKTREGERLLRLYVLALRYRLRW